MTEFDSLDLDREVLYAELSDYITDHAVVYGLLNEFLDEYQKAAEGCVGLAIDQAKNIKDVAEALKAIEDEHIAVVGMTTGRWSENSVSSKEATEFSLMWSAAQVRTALYPKDDND